MEKHKSNIVWRNTKVILYGETEKGNFVWRNTKVILHGETNQYTENGTSRAIKNNFGLLEAFLKLYQTVFRTRVSPEY